MASNPYFNEQPVYIKDPSGRLGGALSQAGSTFHFPYTPTITVISSAGFSSYDPTHSNYQQKAFDLSTNSMFTLTAPIVVENDEQGQTLLEGMRFFRGAMKMNFGPNDPDRGLPPPVLRLYAYGIYENIPCVVTDFTHNLDSDVDYVTLDTGERVPVLSTFVLTLQTTYSPKNVRENFTLDSYLTGNLRNKGYV